VLNLLAPALWAGRMSGFMFSEMFCVLEGFAALLAAVSVGRHSASRMNSACWPDETIYISGYSQQRAVFPSSILDLFTLLGRVCILFFAQASEAG
jgi:hypothetical protein